MVGDNYIKGLQSGVVEGQYVAIPWQEVAKLHEVTKYYTEIGGFLVGKCLSNGQSTMGQT